MSRAVDGAGHLEQPVGERRLPVVDVGDDAEAADAVEGGHDPSIVADRASILADRYRSSYRAADGPCDRRRVGERRPRVARRAAPRAGRDRDRRPVHAGARRQGREPGRGRGRARRRGAASSAASATTSTGAASAPTSRRAASTARRLATTRRRRRASALIMVDARRRERRSRSRPARTARSSPDAARGRDRRPTTSCCARCEIPVETVQAAVDEARRVRRDRHREPGAGRAPRFAGRGRSRPTSTSASTSAAIDALLAIGARGRS